MSALVSYSNGTQSYTNANELNQYPSITPIGGALTSIAYDANGNLTGDGVNTFGYDAENRFLSVSGGASATYAYDALDRRMTKTTGGATTRYLHAGSDEIAEYNSSGTLLRRFVPGPGTDERAVWIESASTSPPATALSYPHTDRLGSVLAVTSNTGAVSARYEYNGWGGSNSSSAGYPFRYTGQRLDPETGLMFYKARIYSMALGRFLQTDPIGTKDDLNLYAYTRNDPVNRSDPSGTEAVTYLMENDPHFASPGGTPITFDDVITAYGQTVDAHIAQAQANPLLYGYEWTPIASGQHAIDDGVEGNWGGAIFNVATIIPAFKGAKLLKAADKTAYSVAFETRISKLGNGTRPDHFIEANLNLKAAIDADPHFAKLMSDLGVAIPNNLGTSPAGWTWHHVYNEPRLLQLVPRSQHSWGSAWQAVLHPGPKGEGGFAQWGSEY